MKIDRVYSINENTLGGYPIPEEFQPVMEKLREEGHIKASWTIGEKVHEARESWDALLDALERSEVRERDCELIFGKRDDGQEEAYASRETTVNVKVIQT